MRWTAATAAALMLVGCAEFRENTSAGIAEAVAGSSLGPKQAPTADFVLATRPAAAPYMPIGVTPPPRSSKPKTQAEVEATQARLAASAREQQARGASAAAEGQRLQSRTPRAPRVE